MKKIISFEFAAKASFVLYLLFIVFHLLVIAGIIPQNIVWGGRIESKDELIIFEVISIIILLLCLLITHFRNKYVNHTKFNKVTKAGMWLLFILFSLNTVGNLFAVSILEKALFTPITILLAFFALRLALGRETQ